jgi:CHAT domain-containing protein/Tfp pilus assembly protein PilF
MERSAQGRYGEAVSLAEEALIIRERALGPDHPDVARSLNNLADYYGAVGDYGKIEPLFQRALTILERDLGPAHPDVATLLNNLGGLSYSLGEYGKAEGFFERSLAAWEKALGPEHPDVALSLSNLAMVHAAMGEHSKAEAPLQRALAIRERALGPEDPDVALNLDNLGGVRQAMGDYYKAESLYRRALAIREKRFGAEHPDVALSLNNLAALYDAIGDYATAEPMYQRSLAIREKLLGPDHLRVAVGLNNLAGIYDSLGDYTRAEPLYARSLAIKEKVLGPEHPEVALSLNNLGVLYKVIGKHGTAEAYHQRSLAIKEKVLGPEHPDLAMSLNNLANVYQSRAEPTRAQPLYERVVIIYERAFGADHPHVAVALNNLAVLHKSQGHSSTAEVLLQRAREIHEKALGQGHPDVAVSLSNLASLYAAVGRFEQALDLEKRVQRIHGQLIEQVLGFTSEAQKMKYLAKVQGDLHGLLSLIAQHLGQDPGARRDALDAWLRRKGMTLEAQRRFQEVLAYSDDPEALEVHQELARLRGQISRLAFAGPGKEAPGAYRKKLAELDARKERLEARLSQLSHAFALKERKARVDCDQVAGALPPDTALIEFAKIDLFNFRATNDAEKWGPPRYLGFVLKAGRGGEVALVDLGEAERIDRLVARLKREMAEIGTGSETTYVPLSRKLHDLVFQPLRDGLGEVREIFISPDGNLSLIPFEVLQGPDGRYLIEDYTFNYLAAGKDLLGFGKARGDGAKALLLGDPDFDLDEGEEVKAPMGSQPTPEKPQGAGRRSTDMMGLQFPRLPGTRQEVREIGEIIGQSGANLYVDREALEELLLGAHSPRILHLATHGFFLEDQGIMAGTGLAPGQGPRRLRLESPFLRSGIALAGANRALRSEAVEATQGIVTAEKILGLRLRGTEMVVLSACETGLGEVRTGEGVFGLRRAFVQAGARGLVMSMWAVPDEETRELMVAFYRKMASGGTNPCQALRQAALQEMAWVRERYGHANPFLWGAFVFMGEP